MKYLLLLFAVTAVAADIEFTNPGFEDGLAGKWKSSDGVRLSTGKYTEGKQGVSFDGNGAFLQYDFNIPRLSEGAKVTISFDIAATGDARWGIIKGNMRDGKWSSGRGTWNRKADPEFKHQELPLGTFLPPAEGTRLYFALHKLGDTGTLFVDNFELQVDYPPPEVVPPLPPQNGKPLTISPPRLPEVKNIDGILTLPKIFYGITGHEAQIYLKQLSSAPPDQHIKFKVDCPVGEVDGNVWRFRPNGTGRYPFIVTATDANENLLGKASAEILISSPANTNDKNITFLAVGDSLTAGTDNWIHILHRNMTRQNPHFRMIGSHAGKGAPLTAGGPACEAYGGWTTLRYLSQWGENIYRFPTDRTRLMKKVDGKLEYDMKEYFDKYAGGQPPDVIVIFLGVNDIAGAKDENREEKARASAENLNRLVEGFRQAAPESLIGLVLLPGANDREQAFRSNYRGAITHSQYSANRMAHVRALLEKFGTDRNVSLIPLTGCLDTENGYPPGNALHPNASGHAQIAAVMEAWLKGNAR